MWVCDTASLFELLDNISGISPRGSKGRLSCVAGEGYTGDDGGPFTACLMNTFKADPGAGSCTACPRGTGTEQIGAVECLCLPGTCPLDPALERWVPAS